MDYDSMPASPTEHRWRAADVVALAKPGITWSNVLMVAGGMALSHREVGWATALGALGGTLLVVAGANALNQAMEGDLDARMARTRDRPLAAGRASAPAVVVIGAAWIALGLALLVALVNALTAGLAAFALATYVGCYTPLKRRSPAALFVGAIPGAVPPLMGWTAATGEISAPGVVLFAILFFWQVPHFLAIALFRADEYRAAGIRALSVVRGEEAAKLHALVWSLLLVPVSLLPVPIGVAGLPYFAIASGLGVWLFITSMRGFEPDAGAAWARSLFLVSVFYLPGLAIGLALDAVITPWSAAR